MSRTREITQTRWNKEIYGLLKIALTKKINAHNNNSRNLSEEQTRANGET